MTRGTVCHLIDFNRDTAYFRAIARHHDRSRFPVLVGSLEGAGPLQAAMASARHADLRARRARRLERLDRGPAPGARSCASSAVGLVHAHCFFPTLSGLAAARIAGVPFVFTRHHSDHHLRLGKRWHTRVDGWSAREGGARDRGLRGDAAHHDRARGRPRGAHRGRVERHGAARRAVARAVRSTRASLGLAEASLVCLLVARLHEEKGHAVLLRALPAVLRAVPGLVVLCAGDGPHRAALERETAERGLAAHVRFLGQRARRAGAASPCRRSPCCPAWRSRSASPRSRR